MHCPHGDTARALQLRELTRAHGLEVGAYGSYYRLGVSEAQGLSFSAVLGAGSRCSTHSSVGGQYGLGSVSSGATRSDNRRGPTLC